MLAERDPRRGHQGFDFCLEQRGVDDFGIGILLQTKQVQKIDQLLCRREQRIHAPVSWGGGLSCEFIPKATLAERMRAVVLVSLASIPTTGVGR